MLGDVLLIEKKHEDAAQTILERVLKERKEKYMVAIAGESGSGKTELAHVLDDSQPTLVVVHHDCESSVRALAESRGIAVVRTSDLLGRTGSGEGNELPDIDANRRAMMLYTSGTTGVPRGAVYAHQQAWEDSRTYIINLSIQPDDKHIQISPIFHIAGDTMLRSILYVGGCNVIMKFFDAAATLKLIQDEKATM